MIFFTIKCMIVLIFVNIIVAKKHRNERYVSTAYRKRRASLNSVYRMEGGWKLSKQEIMDLFNEYYECLKQSNSPQNQRTEAINAVLALEGQRVELKCPTCLRPDQDDDTQILFWQRVRNEDATAKMIQRDTDGMKINKDMTLVIQSVDVGDAGQYFCFKGKDALAAEVIYQVDVLFKEPQKSVWENATETLFRAQKIIDHNIQIFTSWSEWGECDQCNKPGQRMKFGTCMVAKTFRDKPITPEDVPILSLYANGVPCRSTVLPRQLSNIPAIRDRPSEILIGNCFQNCPTIPPPIAITDSSGKVVKILEGGYVPFGKKVEIPKMVVRKVMHKAESSKVVLACPTSEISKVRWQRGERAINTATIRHETRGRVYIDKLNRLHIQNLRMKDSAPYNCWVWQTHIATIKVIAFKPMNENLKHYITYGGLFLTIIFIPLFCICKICCGKSTRRG